MVRKLLTILLIFTLQFTFSQEEEKILFSDALTVHLPKYEKKAKEAYRYRNFERGENLFDSLVENHLKGSIMDNFQFSRLKASSVSLYDFEKPVYLITYASWCITTEGEIPALNELAAKYHDKIDFVVLFWDTPKATKSAARNYNKHIKILYVNELDNNDAFVVSQLKHSLGLPTVFLLNEKKEILDIRRGVTHSLQKSLEESIDMNYNSIYDGIANHLLTAENLDTKPDPVAVN